MAIESLDEEKTDEIEITDEMIAAGARTLMSFETYTANEEYWAELVYRAMRKAAPIKAN